MNDPSDHALLQAYLAGSQDAFAQLANRYTGLVFSAAMRQVKDPHLAQDITQAVFLILAQKARRLSRSVILPGWLLYVTRFTSKKALTMQSRRRRHEQKAAAMNPAPTAEAASDLAHLLPHLDEALARLPTRDRDALTLRFLQQKSFSELSSLTGIPEDTAQKRVSRALDKLRRLFAQKNITLSVAALATLLASTPLLAAPPYLLAATSLAGAQTAAASAVILSIAKGATHMMTLVKLQLAAAVAASVLILGGAGALLHYAIAPTGPPSHAAPTISIAAPPSTDPATPLGTFFLMKKTLDDNDADAFAAIHAPDSPEAADYLAAQQSLLRAESHLIAAYRDKLDPQNQSPLRYFHFMGIPDNPKQKSPLPAMLDDHTCDIITPIPNLPRYRLVRIDNQWRVHASASIASIFPSDPAAAMKIIAQGAREFAAFYDEFAKDIAAGKFPSTDAAAKALDDRLTKTMSAKAAANPLPPILTYLAAPSFRELNGPAADFRIATDSANTHTGLPSLLLTSTSPDPTANGTAYLGIKSPYKELPIKDYLGKRIRFSAWVKTENVKNWGGLFLMALSRTLKQWETLDNMTDRPLSGATDWTRLSIVADITPETTDLNLGVHLHGSGKIWMDDPSITVVDTSVPPTDDHQWHLESLYPTMQLAALDPAEKHADRPALKITSTDTRNFEPWYGLHERHPGPYKGHTIRLSAWIKSAGLSDNAQLCITAAGPNGPHTRIDSQSASIPANSPWKLYTTTAKIPADATELDLKLLLPPTATLWITEPKIEIIDPSLP